MKKQLDPKTEDVIEKAVAKAVAEAPPLSAAKLATIAHLFRAGQDLPVPEETEATLQERERAQKLLRAKELARQLVACSICGAPPEAHSSTDHPWEPGEAEHLLDSAKETR